MTTERSGMSLEIVRDEARSLQRDCYEDCSYGASERYKRWADAIDAHLSRDAVVSDSPLSVFNQGTWTYSGTGQSFTKAEMDEAAYVVYRESFAARHAGVPDVVYENLAKIADGQVSVTDMQDMASEAYNVLRKAMLAQRDGG